MTATPTVRDDRDVDHFWIVGGSGCPLPRWARLAALPGERPQDTFKRSLFAFNNPEARAAIDGPTSPAACRRTA